MPSEEKKQQYKDMAAKLMKLARDTIAIRYRFFDVALGRLEPVCEMGLAGVGTDGKNIYYDPVFLLYRYMEENNFPLRVYMHTLLHCVFMHQYECEKVNITYWNIATDIAVENIIINMDVQDWSLSTDSERKLLLEKLKKNVNFITAEKVYREFMVNGISADTEAEYKRLFSIDLHDDWQQKSDELVISKEEWDKIATKIKTELKAFSDGNSLGEDMENNLFEATREKYNYSDIIRRFFVTGEEIILNDEEFDYVYYTYGLSNYGNMPLVEPLEYKETNRVKEFVIAIDTSASCRGELIKKFLNKTYNLLKEKESFFSQVNVHIIQCDSQIRNDIKITDNREFENLISDMKLSGFGSTDFRPVFSYVEELKNKGEFSNLKGLIYFTDGYGTYPERMPDYKVVFAFLNQDKNRAKIPGWAMEVIMEDELYEY